MRKQNPKKRIPDLPFDTGGAAMAILMAMAEGFSDLDAIFGFDYPKSRTKSKRSDSSFDWCSEIREVKKESLRTIAWRLKKKGLIEKTGEKYQLSVFGMEMVRKVQDEEKEEAEWDGKWRMVIFDIPETMRNERDWIRKELGTIDYRPVQRSVFFGQYPLPPDFLKELGQRNLKNCVRFLTVGDVNERELKNIFNW